MSIKNIFIIAACVSGCRPAGESDHLSHDAVEKAVDDVLSLRVLANVSDNLGLRIADGRPIDHEFRLRNPTDRPIQILGAMASTPCCSSIGPIPRSIPAHGEAGVPVRFRAGYQSGPKRLQFIAATDHEECKEIRMFLNVDLRPSWEVGVVGDAPCQVPEGAPARRSYRIITRRKGNEGLLHPSGLEMASPLVARFAGDRAERRMPGEIIEVESVVEVTFPAARVPGVSSADLRLGWPDGSSQIYPIRWEVIPLVHLTPSTVVVQSGDSSRMALVTIRSEDRPIRIIKVNGSSLARPIEPRPDASHIHRLELMIDATRSSDRRAGSVIEILTDHPSHATLKINVLIVSGKGGGAS